MITNKDIRVENGFLIINGDKYPLDGQSPEAIMEIVESNSDTTPTENSTAPVTSGGVYTALGTKQDTLTFDDTPTENSTNPVESGGVYSAVKSVNDTKRPLSVSSATIGTVVDVSTYNSNENAYTTPHEGFVRFSAAADSFVSLAINDYRTMKSTGVNDYKGMWLPKGVKIYFTDATPALAQWFNCSEA